MKHNNNLTTRNLTQNRNPGRYHGLLGKFRRQRDGVAAIEFAMIAPLMILMFVGTLEISAAVAVNRKVSRVSSALGDLITQSDSLTNTDINNIMDATGHIMVPYDSSDIGIVLTGISIENGASKVVWSRSRGATARGAGTAISVPTAISQNDSFLVIAEVSGNHTPMVGWPKYKDGYLSFDDAAIQMSERMYLRPRGNSAIQIN